MLCTVTRYWIKYGTVVIEYIAFGTLANLCITMS